MSSSEESPQASPFSSLDPQSLESMDQKELAELYQTLENLKGNKSSIYQPYPKQLEFHAMGSEKRFRCLMAANQVGKTYCAGMETSYHLQGIYPDFWKGRRFLVAPRAWAGGPNSEHVRDNLQRILFGPPGEEGTGTIPGHAIVKIERSRGIKNAIDYALVRHSSGGNSYIKFKSYDQETDAWSGDTLTFIWFDEEPPEDKWQEGITRTNTGDNGSPGFIYMTMTPLLGMTKIARRFHPSPSTVDSGVVQMGLRDALHYSEDDIRQITDAYPEHERRARVLGFPQLGEGAVFSFEIDDITCEPPSNVPWWLTIGGIDFGWDHPAAAAELKWDRDGDILYVTRIFRQRKAKTAEIASVLRSWGADIPWAWPHDGYVHDRQSGKSVSELFREEGLAMLENHATFPDGSMGLEAGILEMNNRFATGRLKISKSCLPVIEEIQTYHRKNGRIVKEDDDAISAVRYAMMMRRFGRLPVPPQPPRISGGPTYDPFHVKQ